MVHDRCRPRRSAGGHQLLSSGEKAVIEIDEGQVRTWTDHAADPDLVLDGPPRAILGLLTGMIDITGATQIGLTVSGRSDLPTRLRPIAENQAPAHRT
ncbi:hypothetical protein [Actinoallomurus sp. CA-142502]|uniref:hypothetical protein n=1 Tax=Actinoallomurus sp. CA-142502 TaxID=3239885 RepID=UPI003D8F854D